MAPLDLRELLKRAAQCEREGRLADALSAYQEVLSTRPDLPNTWYNRALVERRLGQYEAALASYAEALARGASEPEEILLNRAVIFSDYLRQDAAAERELEAALALNSSYVPALLNLANLREDHGRRADALLLYERILSLQPSCYEALARRLNLKGVEDARDPLVARARDAITGMHVKFAEKASVGFALGKALDGCGEYAQAFAAYEQANRDSRSSVTPRPDYDRRAQEALIDEIIAAFPRPMAATVRDQGPQTPIFVCGMFRSGSTLAEQVLASHSQVSAGGELPYLPALVQTVLSPFPGTVRRFSQADLRQFADSYRLQLTKLFPSAKNVTDKRPDNFLYIGLIKALFPDARIVHTTRAALDNCLSIFFLHLDQRMSYALDLMDIGHYFGQYRRLMQHWRRLYGPDILDFHYDDFVHAQRGCTERLLSHCGLSWEEQCLRFHEAQNAVRTASVWQVREPLYQRSSGRWRAYAHQLAELRAYLVALGMSKDELE